MKKRTALTVVCNHCAVSRDYANPVDYGLSVEKGDWVFNDNKPFCSQNCFAEYERGKQEREDELREYWNEIDSRIKQKALDTCKSYPLNRRVFILCYNPNQKKIGVSKIRNRYGTPQFPSKYAAEKCIREIGKTDIFFWLTGKQLAK